MHASSFPVFLLLANVIQALWITDQADSENPIYVQSPIFNQNLGRQAFVDIAGPVAYTRESDICDLPPNELTSMFKHKVVFLDDQNLQDTALAWRQVDCLTLCGALAIVKANRTPKRPGIGLFARAPSTADADNTIPLVEVSYDDFPKHILEKIETGSEVLFNVTLDHNEWEEHIWETSTFFVLWRIILPLVNYVGLLLALTASATLAVHQHHTHTQKSKMSHAKRQMRNANMRLLMLSNMLIGVTCALRQFYCLRGPLFTSNNRLAFHYLFLELTVVSEFLTAATAVLVIRNWVSFGVPDAARTLNTLPQRTLIGAALPLYVGLTLYGLFHTLSYTLTVARFGALACVSACVLGIVVSRIVQFMRQAAVLQRSTTRGHRRRIGTFMMLASAVAVITNLARLVHSNPFLAVSASTSFALYSVEYLGLTFQGIAQVVAFFPSLSVVKHGGRIIHKSCLVAQELRQRRHFAAKSSNESRPCHQSVLPDDFVQTELVVDMQTYEDDSSSSNLLPAHPSAHKSSPSLTSNDAESAPEPLARQPSLTWT